MYGLEKTILTSLCICFLYEAYKPSMIFFPIRRLMEKGLSYLPEKVNLYVRKPLFDCVICMNSVYGILFTWNIITFSFAYVLFLFQVAGLNFLISLIIHFFHDRAEEDKDVHEVIKEKEKDAVGIQPSPGHGMKAEFVEGLGWHLKTDQTNPDYDIPKDAFTEELPKLMQRAINDPFRLINKELKASKKKPIIKKKTVKPK